MGSLFGMTDEAADVPDDAGEQQTVAEAGDAALDEAIAKMGGGGASDDGDDDDEDLHVAAAVNGSSLDDDDGEDDAGADEDDEEEPEVGDEDEEGESAELDDSDEELELHRAYTTLHDKVGAPFSVLKSMSRSKLIAWAKQVETKEAGAQASSKSAEQGREATADAKAAKSDDPATGKAKLTWAVARASIAEKLGIDEEAADGLKPLFDELEAVRSELGEVKAQNAETLAQQREREGRATIDANVRRLGKKYPELKSDTAKVEKLVNAAAALLRGKVASSASEAFDKAARAELGRAKRSDLAQLRRNGGSPPSEGRGGFGSTLGDVGEDSYWDKAIGLAYTGRRDLIGKLAPPSALTKKPGKPRR